MQQIADWLEKLGMSEYAQRFAENGIDFSVLRRSDRSGPQGHRRLCSGIAGRCCAPLPSLPARLRQPPQPAVAAEPKPQDTAERRQVTVMFSDLVGSTALSARMDPEDLREVISAYQKCVAETVQRFGGFVAKYMGDGVLVYFGYPQAHEDDAERAVRAGLELVAAVGALKTHAPLQTRVGIATGLVVVGDLIGSGIPVEIHAPGFDDACFLTTRHRRVCFRSSPGRIPARDHAPSFPPTLTTTAFDRSRLEWFETRF